MSASSALGNHDQHSSCSNSSVSFAPRTYSSKHILKQDFSKPNFGVMMLKEVVQKCMLRIFAILFLVSGFTCAVRVVVKLVL